MGKIWECDLWGKDDLKMASRYDILANLRSSFPIRDIGESEEGARKRCLRDTLPQQWHHVKPSQESWACANEYRISNKPEASTVDWTATASGELEALRVDLRECNRRGLKRISIDSFFLAFLDLIQLNRRVTKRISTPSLLSSFFWTCVKCKRRISKRIPFLFVWTCVNVADASRNESR